MVYRVYSRTFRSIYNALSIMMNINFNNLEKSNNEIYDGMEDEFHNEYKTADTFERLLNVISLVNTDRSTAYETFMFTVKNRIKVWHKSEDTSKDVFEDDSIKTVKFRVNEVGFMFSKSEKSEDVDVNVLIPIYLKPTEELDRELKSRDFRKCFKFSEK